MQAVVYDHANPAAGSAPVAKTTAYDALGNITAKSGVGWYGYGANGAGPHAVTSAGSASYTYDANGSMVSGDGRTIDWTSFNQPASIASALSTSTFLYGPQRARLQQVRAEGAAITTTKYVGTRNEEVTLPNGDVEQRHYISTSIEHLLATDKKELTHSGSRAC